MFLLWTFDLYLPNQGQGLVQTVNSFAIINVRMIWLGMRSCWRSLNQVQWSSTWIVILKRESPTPNIWLPQYSSDNIFILFYFLFNFLKVSLLANSWLPLTQLPTPNEMKIEVPLGGRINWWQSLAKMLQKSANLSNYLGDYWVQHCAL